MPFAGRYVLGGKKFILEKHRAEIELEDALEYYLNSPKINQKCNKGIILNQDSTFDLDTERLDHDYIAVDRDEKNQYIENNLSKRKYDYENDENPTLDEFKEVIPQCYERYESKRNNLQFSTATPILIHLPENQMLLLRSDGISPEIISQNEKNKFKKYLIIKTEYRLLLRLMRGP